MPFSRTWLEEAGWAGLELRHVYVLMHKLGLRTGLSISPRFPVILFSYYLS